MKLAIKKAMAPMMGGVMEEALEASASTAAASAGVYPARFMAGMVTGPVIKVFAAPWAVNPPAIALLISATIPGPARIKRDMNAANFITAMLTPLTDSSMPQNMRSHR